MRPEFPLRLVYPVDGELEVKKRAGLKWAYAGGTSLYFQVGEPDDTDAGSWRDAAAAHPLRISIFYLDVGTETIQIAYSNDGTGETNVETIVTKTNTGKPKWSKPYTLAASARFANEVYEDFEYADFRIISSGQLFLNAVRMKETTLKAKAQWFVGEVDDAALDGQTITDLHEDKVSGWEIQDGQLSADNGNVVLNSVTPKITLGAATAFLTGAGFFVGKSSGYYSLHVGDPAGQYMSFNGATGQLYVSGTIAGTIVSGGTDSNSWIINQDLTDTNVDLVFGRNTGGNGIIRWNGSVINALNTLQENGVTVAKQNRAINTTAPLTGGGDLSADRTLAVTLATPNIALGSAAAAGTANSLIRSDATIAAFDATVPSTITPDATAATGIINFAARRDHTHGIVAAAPSANLTVSTSNAEGASTSFARADHSHAITSSSNPGAAASLLATDASGFLNLVRLNVDTLTDKSGGNLTVAPMGDVVFNPTGKDLLPNANYDLNIGALSKKYLTLHAAELWVETLVAQNTLATIGGRILVLPTNILIADCAPAATTLDVKYNNLANGDRIYLEANGAVEFMAVTSGATTISGGYRYSVTRNLDGSGANQWYAGDAVANTGQTGSGFIDLYSVRGVKASSEVGPTIVGNVRNSATYNDWSPTWAVGNLNGLYGYGANTPGAAFGKYVSGQPNITIETTNGIRIRNFTTVIGQWDTSGNITVGEVGASKSNVYITSNKVQLRTNTTVNLQLDTAGKVTVGEVANSKSRIEVSAGAISGIARSAGGADATYFNLDTAGNVTLGAVATNHGNAYWNNSNKRLEFRGGASGTVVQAYVDTNGAIMAGGGYTAIDANGIGIIPTTYASDPRAYKFVSSIGGTVYGGMYYYTDTSTYGTLNLSAKSIAGFDVIASLNSNAPTGKTAMVNITANGNGIVGAGITLLHSSTAKTIDFTGDASFDNSLGMASVSYAPSSGTKNDVSIAANASVVNAAPAGNITITGFTGGYEGKILVVVNTSIYTITFKNQDASSGVNNRIVIGDAANKTISGQGSAMMIYVANRWRWISLDA